MIPCSLINLARDPNATPPQQKKKSFIYAKAIKTRNLPSPTEEYKILAERLTSGVVSALIVSQFKTLNHWTIIPFNILYSHLIITAKDNIILFIQLLQSKAANNQFPDKISVSMLPRLRYM